MTAEAVSEGAGHSLISTPYRFIDGGTVIIPSMFFSAYREFATRVRSQRRYVLDSVQTDFLAEVRSTTASRVRDLLAGTMLWRAQEGFDGYTEENVATLELSRPKPYEKQRMKPREGRAKEGRANPKGIPFLYCSTDRDTAMSEVRPWLGAHITLAEMKTVCAVRIVDCSADTLTPMQRTAAFDNHEALIWADINDAFSEPVSETDDAADYAPTQILAELFRDLQYEGIKYKSRVGPGVTIALFQPEAASVVSRCVWCVTAMTEFEFQSRSSTYLEPDHPNSTDFDSLPSES